MLSEAYTLKLSGIVLEGVLVMVGTTEFVSEPDGLNDAELLTD